MASGSTPIYLIPYPLSTDTVDVHGDIQDLALQVEDALSIKADKNTSNTFTQPNVFNVNSPTSAVRINQTGSGSSFVVEDSSNPDSTPFIIDASGNVGIGKTTPAVLFDVAGVGAFSGALTASTFNALSLVSNATGFRVSGGTTAVAVTFAGGAAYTLSGTNGTTITLPATTGTLALNNQAFFIGTQSIAINAGTGTITALPGVSSINGSTIPASVTLAANVTTTLGDLIYASANGTPGTLARLAGNTTTTKQFLSQTGNGTISAVPSWSALANGDIPTSLTGKSYNGLTLTSTTGTFTLAALKTFTVNNTMTLSSSADGNNLNIGTGGTLGSAAFTASTAYEPSITTLAISKGGTGTGTAPTQYGVIYATSTTAYASTAAGTNTQVLIGNASGAPTWTNISGLSVSSATTATNLSGTTQYSIPYQSASGTTSYIAIGAAGRVLTVNGTANGYIWSAPLTNPMTTEGDIIYGGSAGAATRLAGSATNGHVLTYNTSTNAPQWAASPSGYSAPTLGSTSIASGATVSNVNALTINSTTIPTSATLLTSGGALGTPASGTLTNATGLPIAGLVASTSAALGVGSIELGHATDTTISRVSAGVIAIEGVTVDTISAANNLTNKTLTSPTITTPQLQLETTSRTTEGSVSWDSTNDYLRIGSGTVAKSFFPFDVNITAKTAAYPLVLADANTLVQMNGAFAFTVPLNSTVAYPTGTTIHLIALTTGVSVTFTGGITSYATPGTKLRAAGSMATLIKLGTDTWVLTGDLTA
jgi:DNA/RNA endonuclease YhcR with UshA esterase domain